jgi:HD-GYP domain-containing protein (c-di-GMP phosphodiesterase class II)
MPQRQNPARTGDGSHVSSSQAGYLPLALNSVPVSALRGIPVYIRVQSEGGRTRGTGFRLYCARHVRFTESRLRQLVQNKVRFLYIPTDDHEIFRRQAEHDLDVTAADPSLATPAKSAIIYNTSVALIDDVLENPDLETMVPRLSQVTRSVASLVINDASAFRHLLAASSHDFYTATHMVNVGTWMVSLAYALGTRDPAELATMCEAGMLHDLGKLDVPAGVLNKKERLTPEDWAALRRHPVAGYERLAQCPGMSPIVLAVAREHHERMDGSGYPDGLVGDEINPVSRICAVVDSFDALTAVRPFRGMSYSAEQALDLIQRETPTRYDADVVKAWVALVGKHEFGPAEPVRVEGASRRTHKRSDVNCAARFHRVFRKGRGIKQDVGLPILAHSLSISGLGFLCQYPIPPGQFGRIYLDRDGWRDRPLEGRTVRCRTHSDCWHEIGVSLCDIRAEMGKSAGTSRDAA